jgi:hypothetical protein
MIPLLGYPASFDALRFAPLAQDEGYGGWYAHSFLILSKRPVGPRVEGRMMLTGAPERG